MRLAPILLVLLFAPLGHALASPFVVGTLRSYKGLTPPVYPPIESLTYEQLPRSNPQAAAALAAGQAFHRLSDSVPNPELNVQRCAQDISEQFGRFQESVDAVLVYFIRAQSNYVVLLMMGGARYAMSAAERLGRLYQSLEDRYESDNLLDCVEAAGLEPRAAGFDEPAFEAMHFCDRVAIHFHHPETACHTWLRNHNHYFHGNPMELTGQRRYERSDWARNGLSHIANTTNHDTP